MVAEGSAVTVEVMRDVLGPVEEVEEAEAEVTVGAEVDAAEVVEATEDSSLKASPASPAKFCRFRPGILVGLGVRNSMGGVVVLRLSDEGMDEVAGSDVVGASEVVFTNEEVGIELVAGREVVGTEVTGADTGASEVVFTKLEVGTEVVGSTEVGASVVEFTNDEVGIDVVAGAVVLTKLDVGSTVVTGNEVLVKGAAAEAEATEEVLLKGTEVVTWGTKVEYSVVVALAWS